MVGMFESNSMNKQVSSASASFHPGKNNSYLRMDQILFAFMMDCCPSLATAISQAYLDMAIPPRLSWCFFHVLRVAHKKAIESAGKVAAEDLLVAFMKIAYAVSPQVAFEGFVNQWAEGHPCFVHYIHMFWMKHVARWARKFAHPNNQGIHTNNYVEVWHHILKFTYLPFEPDFKIASSKVLLGFQGQQKNKAQAVSQHLASAYSLEDLQMLGICIIEFPGCFLVDSFSNPSQRTYLLKTRPDHGALKAQVTNCNCEHFAKGKLACKHMYVIAENFNLVIVEDPTSIFSVTWLNGPYGNITTHCDYATFIRSQNPHLVDLIPQPWPLGLKVDLNSSAVVDLSSLACNGPEQALGVEGDNVMVIEDSQDIVVLDEDDSPKTLVEAQLMAPSLAEPSDSWFGSQIIASVMSPKVTCQFHNKGKLVTDCSCKTFQECRRPCFHMHNMCRTLGLELYVLAPDSDVSSIPNMQEISIDPQSCSLNKPSITASDIITSTQSNPCQETLTHTDFTCPLVKSTVASVKHMEKVLGSNRRVHLVNSVPPALVEEIHNSANELEQKFCHALDSGRPTKQHHF
ncbi:hypothetical protein CROQUDRAFT_675103 [Cronartium quercuum f. sp. fusiforme G11]|uniref:SWIM-type domain-containing protein n=1 Tax=Cronartium quercuum f. sp. fusiforme G11 TaxID=708437 RepID=A0A9P6T6J4_9BASI|nr:hypothetical protein CROQUDRAFT_675103 [Cronartium quercuum f. sp. fusiforme G11]